MVGSVGFILKMWCLTSLLGGEYPRRFIHPQAEDDTDKVMSLHILGSPSVVYFCICLVLTSSAIAKFEATRHLKA